VICPLSRGACTMSPTPMDLEAGGVVNQRPPIKSWNAPVLPEERSSTWEKS
jgi:hypothetical protein